MAKNVGYVSLTTLPARLKLDDMKAVAVVGFSGVQALDVVGPFETFTCASRFVDDETWQLEGYEVMLASVDGQPVPASTGLGLMACPLPDPEQVDTVVIPGGVGVRQAAADPALMTWFREAAEPRTPDCQRLHRGVPRRGGRSAQRLPGDHPLGVRRRTGATLSRGQG